MDDQALADDARRARPHGDDVQRYVDLAAAILARLERGQVAGVALARRGIAVRLAVRVEVALGAHAVARAAVAGLVDVKAVLPVGSQPLGEDDDAHLAVHLLEGRLAEGLAALGGLQRRSGAQRFLGGHAGGRAGGHALARTEQDRGRGYW